MIIINHWILGVYPKNITTPRTARASDMQKKDLGLASKRIFTAAALSWQRMPQFLSCTGIDGKVYGLAQGKARNHGFTQQTRGFYKALQPFLGHSGRLILQRRDISALTDLCCHTGMGSILPLHPPKVQHAWNIWTSDTVCQQKKHEPMDLQPAKNSLER